MLDISRQGAWPLTRCGKHPVLLCHGLDFLAWLKMWPEVLAYILASGMISPHAVLLSQIRQINDRFLKAYAGIILGA